MLVPNPSLALQLTLVYWGKLGCLAVRPNLPDGQGLNHGLVTPRDSNSMKEQW